MVLEVTIQLIDEDGKPVWGYHHMENLVPSDDSEESAAKFAAELFRRVDDGRASLEEQVQREMADGRLSKAQAAAEEAERRSRG